VRLPQDLSGKARQDLTGRIRSRATLAANVAALGQRCNAWGRIAAPPLPQPSRAARHRHGDTASCGIRTRHPRHPRRI